MNEISSDPKNIIFAANLEAIKYSNMKVSALIFLCIVAVTVAVAIPVQLDSNSNSQLTLADIENEQNNQNNVDGITDDNSPAAREKRFILKKLALAKLAHFGLG